MCAHRMAAVSKINIYVKHVSTTGESDFIVCLTRADAIIITDDCLRCCCCGCEARFLLFTIITAYTNKCGVFTVSPYARVICGHIRKGYCIHWAHIDCATSCFISVNSLENMPTTTTTTTKTTALGATTEKRRNGKIEPTMKITQMPTSQFNWMRSQYVCSLIRCSNLRRWNRMYGVNQLANVNRWVSLPVSCLPGKKFRELCSLSSAHTGQWETVRLVASAIGLLAMSGVQMKEKNRQTSGTPYGCGVIE